jgi:hypothetical protein
VPVFVLYFYTVGLCQLVHPVRRLFPRLYAALAEVHLNLQAAWLASSEN